MGLILLGILAAIIGGVLDEREIRRRPPGQRRPLYLWCIGGFIFIVWMLTIGCESPTAPTTPVPEPTPTQTPTPEPVSPYAGTYTGSLTCGITDSPVGPDITWACARMRVRAVDMGRTERRRSRTRPLEGTMTRNPMLDPQRDLAGATPETLARALLRPAGGAPRPGGEAVVRDEVAVEEVPADQPRDDGPHLRERA